MGRGNDEIRMTKSEGVRKVVGGVVTRPCGLFGLAEKVAEAALARG
jgi:hypothetical protein